MLSIIIVNYNTRELLRQCLHSVRQHAPGTQAIVVDNASRDGSADMVRQEFPEVHLHALEQNLGFARGNNVGLESATGDHVVLLNSDTVLQDQTLLNCEQWLEAHPDYGAITPRLIGTDGKPQGCSYPFPSLRRMLRETVRLSPGEATAEEPRWLPGTALMIRRNALASIGGTLDSGYFFYWEDADLSARLLQAGWKLGVYEAGYILHHGGASGGGPDGSRRADLHAWYVFGKHRWFSNHRSTAALATVWCLDLLDVGRKWLRGLRRGVCSERQQARAILDVLAFKRLNSPFQSTGS